MEKLFYISQGCLHLSQVSRAIQIELLQPSQVDFEMMVGKKRWINLTFIIQFFDNIVD
jgi:hypothetical protein